MQLKKIIPKHARTVKTLKLPGCDGGLGRLFETKPRDHLVHHG